MKLLYNDFNDEIPSKMDGNYVRQRAFVFLQNFAAVCWSKFFPHILWHVQLCSKGRHSCNVNLVMWPDLYRKVLSINTSRLEDHFRFYRLLMKENLRFIYFELNSQSKGSSKQLLYRAGHEGSQDLYFWNFFICNGDCFCKIPPEIYI